MTARLTDEDFRRLTALRVSQGFTAAQLVVGIPPETTPDNPNAASPVGPAWTFAGEFNPLYLGFARERIKSMNRAGLTAIVYGAWGPQINWLGTGRMTEWWREVIKATNDLDVIYCLTGESSLQISWQDLSSKPGKAEWLRTLERQFGRSRLTSRIANRLLRRTRLVQNRRRAWSRVLQQVANFTDKPILVHPTPPYSGFDCVENPHLLAANTAQTGHTAQSRPRLHRLPLAHAASKDPAGRGFINLEPWYEGILNQFYGADQLYAYWVSMLAGAVSYCYGAHGIWNAGDGSFLAHWGCQTFSQALELDTPRLIGLSHQLYQPFINHHAEVTIQEEGDVLVSIQRKCGSNTLTFLPEIKFAAALPPGRFWLPMEGRFADETPSHGQVVIIS